MSGSETSTDLRLVPAAAAAWGGMWLATASDPRLLVLGASVGLAVLVMAFRRRSWTIAAVGLVLLGCMVAGVARWLWTTADPVSGLAREQAVAQVEVTLVGSPTSGERQGVRPEWWRSNATVHTVIARGQTLASGVPIRLTASGGQVPPWSTLKPGTTVRLTVRLSVAEPGDGVTARAHAREPPTVISGPGPLDTAVERVRQGLRDSTAGLADDPRALVPALVLGDTSEMSDELRERFKVTGLTHLTAVSGANLTLMLAFLGVAARGLGVRGWWLRGLLAAGVALFVVLCRAEPSVIRAAGMGLVGLAALGWRGRGGNGLRALCVAVIVVLMIDPGMSRSLGFVLSVAASGGIVAWAGHWTDVLAAWLPRWLAEGLAVPLAAQLATQPVVTAISGQISVIGLFANLVAGPLVGPATVAGFLAAGVAQLWLPLGAIAVWPAGWCAQGLCWIARLGELVPGAVLSWPVSVEGVVLVGLGCLGLGLVMRRVLSRPGLAVVAVALLVAALVRPPTQPGWPPPQWQVVFCDIGQGSATVLRASVDQAVVVDAGPDPARMNRCLREIGVSRVPVLVLTHFHSDHVDGVRGVVEGRDTESLVIPSARQPAAGYAFALQGAAPARPVVVGPGVRLTVGQVQLTVVSARPPGAGPNVTVGESTDENDGSLVMMVRIGELTLLLPGDVEEAGQEHALAAGSDLAVDVLLVPHHGSGRQSPGFIGATRARIAVFSAGADNDYGHPAPRTVRLVQGLGMTVLRTDTQGSVAIAKLDGRFLVTTQR